MPQKTRAFAVRPTRGVKRGWWEVDRSDAYDRLAAQEGYDSELDAEAQRGLWWINGMALLCVAVVKVVAG